MKHKAFSAARLVETLLAFQTAIVGIVVFSPSAMAKPLYDIQELGLNLYSYGSDLNNAGQVDGITYESGPESTHAWFFNGSHTQEIGLTGANYTYSDGNQYVYPVQLNNAGEVIGYSDRYSDQIGSAGLSLGEDAWLFDGASTDQIGLTGANYSYATPNGIFQVSGVLQINDAGEIIGSSNRYSPSGSSLGNDSWFINGSGIQIIGLTGGNYSYSASGGTYQASNLVQLNDTGQVAGYSNRFSSSGESLGSDAWFFNGTTAQQIGLSGINYNYDTSGGTYQNSFPLQLNDTGQVSGSSSRFDTSGDSLGSDTWFFNGTTTQQVGLTGGNYGYVIAGGIYQYSSLEQLNAAGQVLGTSARLDSSGNNLGADVWLFDGAASREIGLTGGIYSYPAPGGTYQKSTPQQLNSTGQAIGTSARFTSSGGSLGLDAWIYSGGAARQIGLSGAGYSYAASGGTYQFSQPKQIDDVGLVIGYSDTFDSSGNALGQDGWLFNNQADTTTTLRFSVESDDNYSYTDPEIVTDTGVVLGSYQLFDGSTFEGDRVFYWSQIYGFKDLGSLVSGGLSANGWQFLAGAIAASTSETTPDGSPEFILGNGALVGEPYGTAYDPNGVYLLKAVQLPEPMALAPLAFFLLSVLGRSCRRAGNA